MEKNINKQFNKESDINDNDINDNDNDINDNDKNDINDNDKNDNDKNDNDINKITVLESIKTNYLSWIFILLSIILVSYPYIISGFITFFIFFFLSYFIHLYFHTNKNIFSIIHHYHHDNNNFFSHFSQILLELFLSVLVFPLYYLFNVYLNYNLINIWIGLLYVLFYLSVHNYNYGQLKINDVHYLHHKYMFTNIGPDICDIAFNTKHPNSKHVENTNHYIPNVIVTTIFILFVKHLCVDENVRDYLLKIFLIIMALIFIFLSISSIYFLS